MKMRQIRTAIETRAMIEKLKAQYTSEKFADELVVMTVGYVLNTAFGETETTTDWTKVIDTTPTIEEQFFILVKDNKTPITRFRLSDKASEGVDKLTKKFAEDLGLKVQVGFTVKQILKAALLNREEKE